MLREWFDVNPEKPVRLTAAFVQVTLLPLSIAEEIRNHKRLNFSKWTYNVCLPVLPVYPRYRIVLIGSKHSTLNFLDSKASVTAVETDISCKL